jgi:hypothetical protein
MPAGPLPEMLRYHTSDACLPRTGRRLQLRRLNPPKYRDTVLYMARNSFTREQTIRKG